MLQIVNRVLMIARGTMNSASTIIKNRVNPVDINRDRLQQFSGVIEKGANDKNEYLGTLFYIKYLKDRDVFIKSQINQNEFIETASSFGTPVEWVEVDLERWRNSQIRHNNIKKNFKTYLIFNAFTFSLNLITGSLSWALYPALAWLAGLVVQVLDAYQAEYEESIKVFEEWCEKQNKIIEYTAQQIVVILNKLTLKKLISNNLSSLIFYYKCYKSVRNNEYIVINKFNMQLISLIYRLKYWIANNPKFITKNDQKSIALEAIKQIKINPEIRSSFSNVINIGAKEELRSKIVLQNPIINILLSMLEELELWENNKVDDELILLQERLHALEKDIEINDIEREEFKLNLVSNITDEEPIANTNITQNSDREELSDESIKLIEYKQKIAYTAVEVQQILHQLSEIYSCKTNNETLEFVAKAVEQIDNNPLLKDNIYSFIETGTIEVLKEFINHPVINILFIELEQYYQKQDKNISGNSLLEIDFWN